MIPERTGLKVNFCMIRAKYRAGPEGPSGRAALVLTGLLGKVCCWGPAFPGLQWEGLPESLRQNEEEKGMKGHSKMCWEQWKVRGETDCGRVIQIS